MATTVSGRQRPELLAPAGDWECVKAAVENGADAVYFGLDRFNARMRADNFTEADLPELLGFLHKRGVKGYVTFNTLVFTDELPEAERYLRGLIAAGVDAVLAQDVGICRLIRKLSPDLPIHASTQMTVSSSAGIEFARELGCCRVVLARECSIKDIGQMPQTDCRIETFVHGALCVAYSGQCLTSESLGGRSANRGECAQACRMPYDLICDGKPVPLGDRKYLLSPQDLAGIEALPDLIRAGVTSLKIEGRLKSPEYVANITRVYRQALDRLMAAEARDEQSLASAVAAESRYDMEMAFSRGLYTGWLRGINAQELVHARFGKKRGVYLGEVQRIDRELICMTLEAPLKPGDGVVFDAGHPEAEEEGGRVYTVRMQSSKPNARDALKMHSMAHGARGSENRQTGGLPHESVSLERPWQNAEAEIGFGRGYLDLSNIHPGDKVWKTSDPELDRRLRRTFSGEAPQFQRPIDMEVAGRAGLPLSIVAQDSDGHEARVESEMPLAVAQTQPLTAQRLRDQLGRLGGTPFRLGELTVLLDGSVMLPMSELNRLRRELVDRLTDLRAEGNKYTLTDLKFEISPPCGADLRPAGSRSLWLRGHPAPQPSTAISPELIVLVRSMEQLDAAIDLGVSTVYCELEDPKNYREAVSRFRATAPSWGRPLVCRFPEPPAPWTPSDSGAPQGQPQGHSEVALHETRSQRLLEPADQRSAPRGHDCAPLDQPLPRAIFVAPPRIFKPGEEWILKQVRSSEADGYLVRNYDHLQFFAGQRMIGDFSFNVANPLTAEYFLKRFGLERVTASYDLNIAQLDALLKAAPPQWFEVTIHQHMPMFHMDHCVFCAFLSKGTDYTNCGRPCDRHVVKLQDRVGSLHAVKADVGCRNTVFNGRAQTGAENADQLLELGLRRFRIEFVDESGLETARTITKYRSLLRGETTGPEVWRELKLWNQLGVTRGPVKG